ncbi:hypothetical protein IWW54_001898 [Coemansia sp. RSA 2705]|nr:hypothetical protein IWW54_001898 [Coemansia sp. RSA 2705]
MRDRLSNSTRQRPAGQALQSPRTPLRRAATAQDHSAKAPPVLSTANSSSRRSRKTQSGYKSADLQIIPSSDSGDDIECVSTFLQTRKRSRQPNRSSPAPKPVAEPPKSPLTRHSARSRRAKSATQPVLLDTDEDELIEVRTPRIKPSVSSSDEPRVVAEITSNTTRSTHLTPRKRNRTQSARTLAIQSSPTLLHPSSPTIRRFNRNNSPAVVLASDSQDRDSVDCALEPASPFATANSLSGDTVIGTAPRSSALGPNLDTIPASSPPIAAIDSIPETPRRSPTPPAAIPPSRQKRACEDLSSDPISEFCSPLDSPINSRRLNSRHQPAERGVLLSSQPDQSITDAGQLAGSNSPEYTQTGPTQWYQRNQCRNDRDSTGANALGSSPNSGVTTVADEIRNSLGLNLDDFQVDRNAVGSHDAASDDGYSSPLEGFWSLRDQNSQECSIYRKQFDVGARPRPVNQSAAAPPPAMAASAAFNLSPPRRPPQAQQSTSRGRGRGRGRGGLSRCAPGVRMLTTQKDSTQHGSSIRPVVSSRPPFPRPTSRRTVAPVGYNHYADDPFLDSSDFTGWEGRGVSKYS